jgi:probable F420-dependent oxidoreductase
MHFGLFGVNFDACADPDLQRRVALAAEEAGFESVWTGEHVAMPLRDNPVPTPPETPFLDSLVTLARIAGFTSRLRLGTGILVLPHHNPVLLAKSLASLDVLSGGRLIAGFAGGYVEPEFRALGIDFSQRGVITDQHLAAIRALWTEREPRFSGRFATFADIRFEPKPIQRPHPPIVIGGVAPPALRRAARHGDGWYGFALTVERTASIVAELRQLRAQAGRGEEPLQISLTTFEPLTDELVARAEAAGVDRLIIFPRARPEALEGTVRELGARFCVVT